MILICHLLTGAVLALKIKIMPVALLAAFFSHYILDLFPHSDYSIDNLKQKKWGKTPFEILKILIDGGMGVGLILILAQNQFLALAGGFLAVLPDFLNGLYFMIPNKPFFAPINKLLKIHYNFHYYRVHLFRDIKDKLTINRLSSDILGIIFQIATVSVAVFLLL